MRETGNPVDNQQKIAVLEQSVELLGADVRDLKNDMKKVSTDLCSWFDRLDEMVQDLRVSNTRLEEQIISRTLLENYIKEELQEAKKFRNKMLVAAAGGCISLIGYLLQDFVLK